MAVTALRTDQDVDLDVGEPPRSGALLVDNARVRAYLRTDGAVRVLILRRGMLVIHAGDAASVRVRILLDADPRDRGAIAAALGGRP